MVISTVKQLYSVLASKTGCPFVPHMDSWPLVLKMANSRNISLHLLYTHFTPHPTRFTAFGTVKWPYSISASFRSCANKTPSAKPSVGLTSGARLISYACLRPEVSLHSLCPSSSRFIALRTVKRLYLGPNVSYAYQDRMSF